MLDTGSDFKCMSTVNALIDFTKSSHCKRQIAIVSDIEEQTHTRVSSVKGVSKGQIAFFCLQIEIPCHSCAPISSTLCSYTDATSKNALVSEKLLISGMYAQQSRLVDNAWWQDLETEKQDFEALMRTYKADQHDRRRKETQKYLLLAKELDLEVLPAKVCFELCASNP